jgi:hypothetical protein
VSPHGDRASPTPRSKLQVYFFRKRFALATARRCQGANTEAVVAMPRLETSFEPDAVAASTFSLSIRLYSAGEHLFCAISSIRRVNVSHDANIRSVIIVGRDVFRRLRTVITNGLGVRCSMELPSRITGRDRQEVDLRCSSGRCLG